jgi:Tfp pilus assembly protein PilO
MFSYISAVLSKEMRLVVIIAVLVPLLSGLVGYCIAAKVYRADIAELKQGFAEEHEAAQTAHSKALRVALDEMKRAQAESQRLTVDLLEREKQLVKTQSELKEKINEATKHDSSFNGIGSHSLSLYKQAFGYPTAASH